VTLLGQLAQAQTDPAPLDAASLSTPAWPLMILAGVALAVWVWVGWQIRQRRPPLAYAGRRPVPWHGRDVVLMLASLAAMMGLCPTVLLHVYHVEPAADGTLPDQVLAIVFAGLSIGEICVMLLSIALLRWRRGADWADLGLDFTHLGHDLAVGLVGYLFITAPVMLLYSILQPKELHPLIEFVMRQPSQLWLIGLCAVAAAPLVEEFFFRVIFQGWLECWERSTAHHAHVLPALPTGMMPILISSFLFAAVHAGQWPAPVPLFFLALVLGYLYHQTHRLLPSLVVHVLLNGSTFLALWWAVHSGG
jgi:membrane protease YdiL (CAAX protease family)